METTQEISMYSYLYFKLAKAPCFPYYLLFFFLLQNWRTRGWNTTDKWIKKMWYLYTMEFYSATKKNEILSFAGKWMELENIILSEVSQAQK
jgi:hypothetical protein